MTEARILSSVTWMAIAGAAALAIVALVEPILSTASGAVPAMVTVRSCGRLGIDIGPVEVATFAVAALGVAVLLRGMSAALTLSSASRALARLEGKPVNLAGQRIWLLPTSDLVAFTGGWLRPRTFISSGTLRCFDHRQLDAMLAHERHHRRRRDPLRRAARFALGECFFFVPALRDLRLDAEEEAELRADAAAVRQIGGDRRSLASALLEFDARGDHAISPRRADQLIGSGHRPAGASAWASARAAASATGLLGLAIFVLVLDPQRPLHVCASEASLLVALVWVGGRTMIQRLPSRHARGAAAHPG